MGEEEELALEFMQADLKKRGKRNKINNKSSPNHNQNSSKAKLYMHYESIKKLIVTIKGMGFYYIALGAS